MASDHDDEICNPSTNRPFEQVLATNISRRDILKGSLAAAASFFTHSRFVQSTSEPLINFKPVTMADGSGPWPSISADYQLTIFILLGQFSIADDNYDYPIKTH